MKRVMRGVMPYFLVIVMVLQIAHTENYNGLIQVKASQITEEASAVESDVEEPEAVQSLISVDYQELVVEDGYIEGDFVISQPYKLMSDLIVSGNVSINAPLDLNGYNLIIEGTVEQKSVIEINGKLISYGEYIFTAGTMLFEEGTLDIAQDLSFGSENTQIVMQHEADLFIIGGDISLTISTKLTTNINAGIIELKGNYTEKCSFSAGSNSGISAYTCPFRMEDESRLLLSGTEQQNIYICNKASYFNNVEVDVSELELDEDGAYIFGDHVVAFSGLCSYGSYEAYSCPTTYGYAEYKEIPEDTYTVYGSCYYTGELLQRNSYLVVIGDFIQAGSVELKSYTFYVYGDYRVQSLNEKGEYEATDGYLDMSGDGVLYVYRDFYTESTVDHEDYLKSGRMYLCGNFYQYGKEYKNFSTSGSFYCSMRDTSNLTSGYMVRHIYLDNPLDNHIAEVYSNNISNIIIDNGACIDYCASFSKYSGVLYFTSKSETIYYNGNVVILPEISQLPKGLSVMGDLTITSDLKLGCSVSAAGDLYVKSGIVDLNGYPLTARNIYFEDGGDSALLMNQQYPSIKCNDFYFGGTGICILTSGSINISGDFYVKDNGTPNSFVCSENHLITTSGNDGIQTITIENPESCIETLSADNGNLGCTRVTDGTVVHNLKIRSSSYDWENSVEGYKLTEDVVYNEDFILCAGTLDLNGHTLTVNGDFYAERGVITINGGHLLVNGDFNCAYRNYESGELELSASTVDIEMNQESDRIDITGNWYMNFNTHSLKNMKMGDVYLSGNLNVGGTVGSAYSSASETILYGANLHLIGETDQVIEGVSTDISLCVGSLIVEGDKNLEANLPIRVTEKLAIGEEVTYGFHDLSLTNLNDIEGHYFKGNLTTYASELDADTEIAGTLLLKGATDLNGYCISADSIETYADVNLSKGNIKAHDLYMYSKIIMLYEEDTIEVTNFYVKFRTSSVSAYMTDGTIYVAGDFIDRSVFWCPFTTEGNHRVIFEKADKDVINACTYSNDTSLLNCIIFKSKLSGYTLSREREKMAKEVIVDYEDAHAPSVPQELSGTAVNCYQVDLQWEASEDDEELYVYKVYRNGVYIDKTVNTGYTDVILKENTTYQYTVTAVDAVGNESAPSNAVELKTPVDNVAPVLNKYKKPSYSTKSDGSVTFSFGESFEEEESYIDYYIITRDGVVLDYVLADVELAYTTVSGSNTTITVQSGDTTYKDTDMEYGRTYTYGITAVDTAGNQSEEYTVDVFTNLPPVSPPENFQVTSENGYNILSFLGTGTKASCQYQIYRNGSYIKTVYNSDNEQISYIDKSVSVGDTYSYYIIPCNTYGTAGTKTEELSVTTIAENIPPVIESVDCSIPGNIFNENVYITGSAVDDSGLDSVYAYYIKSGETEKYEIKRQNYTNYPTSVYIGFSWNIESLKGIYELHIVAVDHCGNETEEIKECQINVAGLPVVENVNTSAASTSIYMEWEEVEGAESYIVEKKTENGYVSIGKTSVPSRTISNLECDTVYTFRIAAYDENSVRGLSTEDIVVKTEEDTTSPVITSLYGDGSVLGSNTALRVGYSDNYKVKYVRAYYRVSGGTEWQSIGEMLVDRKSGVADVSWDKSNLISGEYEVKYQLEDTNENLSKEQLQTYILDVDAPVIRNFTVTPKDWALHVSWDGFMEKDYASYELRRVTKDTYDTNISEDVDPFADALMVSWGTNKTFFEEEISPKEEYIYQLTAYDAYGNTSTAQVSGQAIDNDNIAPQVISLSPLYAATDIAINLSAYGCSDNDGIASYQWDMGNGDILNGENCEYTYQTVGTYQMKLTVTDYAGNQSSTSTSVTVGKDTGMIKVTVTGNGKKLTNADVVVCVNNQACHSGLDPVTNSQGVATIPIQAGTYQVAAYKEGYIPAETKVTVQAGKTSEITIDLEQGEAIQAEFNTKEMTIKEMEEAGIDTTQNKNVFTYTATLTFSKDNIQTYTFNSTQKEVTYTAPTYSSSSGNIGSFSGNTTKVKITNVSDDPEKPIFIITKTVDVSISWLQNIYQVDVTIQNCADDEFYLEDAKAALNLEQGLELVTMEKGKSNDALWNIGTLRGGESQTHTWYVGANQSGSYPLSVDFEAVMQPFNKSIRKTLTSSEDLKVTVGEGLHLYIYPEKEAYIGEQYYIQFELRNESEVDYHYVTTSFGAYETVSATAKVITIQNIDGTETASSISADTGVNYYVADNNDSDANVTLCTNDKLTVETLSSGESICGTYKFQFDAAGDINREYYKLLNKYVEELNVNNTNVKVTIMPITGHLVKKIVEFRKTKRNTSTSNSNKSNYTLSNAENSTSGNKTTTNTTTTNTTTTNTTTTGAITSTVTTQDSTETVKDPVNLMTGAFTVDHVVAAVAGATDLSFELSYNSLYTDTTGELGRGWYHNYEMRIERNGTMLTLYQNPYEVLYFTESEKTANTVCGTLDGNTILLANDSEMERTYYQTGTDSQVNKITKNADGYVLAAGQEQYTFDTDGILTGYMTSDGKQVTIQKNKETLTITDSATGKSITASYDDEGKITDIVDAAGNRTTLDYDEDYMTVLTSKTGNKLSYEYDEQGRILKGMEADGTVYVENTYDDNGRVLTQTANGKKEELTRFSYSEDTDAETTTVTMTNADGTTQKAVADKFGQGIRYVDAIGGVKEYQYNRYHEMTGYQCSDGIGAEYSYDGSGNVTQIVETTGRTTSYTYDSSNRITRMVCNDGTDVSYTYHANGQTKTITSGNGLKASYTYNEDGQVLTETSELGTITYTYEKGMLRAITDYSGNSHYFTYDANGNVVQYIDGAGIVTDYQVDASGRVTEESITMEDGSKSSISYTYDAYGKVTSKTDAMGNTTSYVYDEEDRLAEEKRPDGKSYTYEYDVNGNITKIICPDGSTTAEAIYDAAGNALSLTDTLKNIRTASYSAGSQLLSMTQSNGGEITYTYYDNGLLESQTDANGNTTVLLYDDAGRISQVTDGVGAVTSFGYDKDGNLASVEDALGNSTKLVYNQYRKVIRQTDANGNVTEYDYDNALNCIRITDAEGGVTELAYDANGNITAMTKKGDTEEQDITLSMTYDNLGNVISLTDGEGNTSRMEYDVNSDLTAVYDAEGVKIQEYDYDCLGNCIKATDALGNVTSNSYDAMGNLVRQMNEGTGNAVTYSYIGGQYLASSTDALGNTASATYDSMGNIATLTNPNGGVTSYQYDLNNNLTDESIGTDYHVSYTYNAQNLAETKVNSRGQQTAYKYDLLGRITKQTDEAGMIDYTYDANGNLLTVTETIGTTVNTITRTYDALNRVTSYEDAKGNKIEYQYDRIGNLVKLIYPNGKAVTYTYDKNCNIKTVTDWENRTTTYSYDSNGRLVKTERPNGTVETRAYDKAGKLIQILDKCGSTVVNQQEYSYDASGNITEVKQLYDGELNFTGVTTAKMTYDENNRLLTYNGKKVQYDKDGNMTYGPLNGKMTEFVFDCRNRLIKAGDTSYEYDAENNRVAVITGGKRTEYVVDSQPELSQVLQSTTYDIATENQQGEMTYYFYGKGLLAQDNQEGYLTYHFNNVGSTMAVTDAKGRVIETYNYTPYGELIDGTYSENIPFLYNGQYGVTTDGNGLYYMRARYYNVDVKRFINQDVLTGTLERISSLNRYAYVEGNPVSYLDPFGLEKDFIDDLHEGIETIQTVLTVLMLGLVLVGTITTAMGNMLGTWYAVYYYQVCEVINNALTALDLALYMYDIYNPENNDNRLNDAVSALLSLFSLAAPMKGMFEETDEVITNMTRFKDVVTSFANWVASEAADSLLNWSKEQ